MYRDRTIGVVIPAHNEELLFGRVVEGMPEFVDKIIIVDDCSKDATGEIVQKLAGLQPGRIVFIQHETNQGVGGAIATGYKWCRDNNIDIAVVMAGDAQMDPLDMPSLLDPVAADEVDYSKGNRLFTGDAWVQIPRIRYLGNSAMSLLTKIASGYWHVADSQCGYTAINHVALKTIDWDKMFKRYGQPNDLLVRLNINNFRVCDVPVRPVYNIGEKSGIKPIQMIPRLSQLLFNLFLYRMMQKYIIRDFHPLIFFYVTGFVLSFLSIPLAFRLFFLWILQGVIPAINALALMMCLIMGAQFLLFAMWFDMEYNRHLNRP
jgi:glycosyltransferase involved in cell wall biosynthesis